MTRFLAAGDLHLWSWPGLAPVDRLADQERVWRRVIEIGCEHGVDAMLFGGDAFHRPTPSPEELLAFARPLLDAPFPVLAITGNSHDTRSAELPVAMELVDTGVFGTHGLLRLSRVPEVMYGDGYAVATLPWTPPGRLVAARDGSVDRDLLNREIADHLVQCAAELRRRIEQERPASVAAVLLLHWSVSGAATPDGALTDLFHEPVLELAALEELEFDIVIGSHIHRPQALTDGKPAYVPGGGDEWIFDPSFLYTGSPLPLSHGEASCEHGVWIVDLDGSARAQFVPIESRPFVTLNVDAPELAAAADLADDPTFLRDMVTGGDDIDGAIVRVRYAATAEQATRIDNTAIRQALLDAGAAKVSVQPDIIREQRARVDGLTEQIDDPAAVDLYLSTVGCDEAIAPAVRERALGYLERSAA